MSLPDLKIAVVCSSNQNRSMEAHNFLSKKGFNVRSFGTGNQVKLPGPAANMPNIYDFDTTYDEMYSDLKRKDPDLCIKPPLSKSMDESNTVVWVDGKEVIREWKPYSKWKMEDADLDFVLVVMDGKGKFIVEGRYTQNGILHMLDRNRRIKPKPERFQACKEHFDIIVSCEERVYDQIIEDLESRERCENAATHIINIDIQDNHEEATIGAFLVKDIVTKLSECDDIDDEIDEIIQEFEHESNRTILHTVIFL